MSRHKLIPYKLKIRPKQRTRDYADLTNILTSDPFEEKYRGQSSAPQTFLEIFDNYCQNWMSNAHEDQDNQKTLGVSDYQDEYFVEFQDNLIEGVFKYGEYGQVADHYDTQNNTRNNNARSAAEAAEMPIYFLLHVPPANPREGLLILEQSNNRGIKLLLQDALSDALPKGATHELKQVSDDDVFGTIRAANKITRFSVEKTESPDALGGGFASSFSQSTNSNTMTYRPTNSGSLKLDVDKLEQWVSNNSDPFKNVNGDTYTEVKITIKSAGSETTIDLTSGNVKIDRTLDSVSKQGGHPIPSSLAIEARKFVNQELPPSGNTIPVQTQLR